MIISWVGAISCCFPRGFYAFLACFSAFNDALRPEPVAADATNMFYGLDAWSVVSRQLHCITWMMSSGPGKCVCGTWVRVNTFQDLHLIPQHKAGALTLWLRGSGFNPSHVEQEDSWVTPMTFLVILQLNNSVLDAGLFECAQAAYARIIHSSSRPD